MKHAFIKTKRKAFSLVELVIVIAVIAILAAAVFLGGSMVINNSRESTVKSDLRNMATYVQTMMYDNPELQYSATYAQSEAFNGTAYTLGTTAVTEADAIKAIPVLNKLLNADYLTADFQLGTTLDAWKKPYCFSFNQLASTGTGKSSSCIVVISSMGVNASDETSNGIADGAAKLSEISTKFAPVAKLFINSDDGMANASDYKKFTSAEDYVSTLTGMKGDDYGVVICMIDGAVSVAYYGFE